MKTKNKINSNQRGAAIVEYAVLVAVISIVIIPSTNLLSVNLNAVFFETRDRLRFGNQSLTDPSICSNAACDVDGDGNNDDSGFNTDIDGDRS